MRYRVELTTRPDGLYAVWRGQAFPAERSTADGTMLLVVPSGEPAPEDFDAEWGCRSAKIVPEDAVDSTFSLETYCLFDDEIFRIAPDPDPHTLTLRWSGHDQRRATQLGLTDFGATTTPDELGALWQERHDFPGSRRPVPGSGEPEALVRAIAQRLRPLLPAGWEQAAAQFRQVGDYAEIEVRSVGENQSVSVGAPPRLGQLFTQLRAAMYQPDNGTWCQGTLTLAAPSSFHFDYDTGTEPNWRQPPGTGRLTAPAHEAELTRFPRDRKQVPEWLAAKAGLAPDVTFRHAEVAERAEPLRQEEIRPVLDYLYRAPVIRTRPGRLPDQINPEGPADVPDAFHTDGTWIWPAAVPHYLRKYGISPGSELLDHIRASSYRVPYVPAELRASAEADVLGHPLPALPQVAAPGSVTLVDRGIEPTTGLRASEVLEVLERRLSEYGIAGSAYRIGEHVEGVWSLYRTKTHWQVSDPGGGEPTGFTHVEAAGRFLLGSLLMYPARTEEPRPVEWPITPLRGEPPLTFFRGKRMVLLPAGRTVLRYGNEAGNLVHDPGTRFVETSLLPEREQLPRRYRLAHWLPALSGVTLPWGPMPGGAVGYLLPHALARHLEVGALERIHPPSEAAR